MKKIFAIAILAASLISSAGWAGNNHDSVHKQPDKGEGRNRADGPCFDNVNRYVDCGNGTVTDTVTGLIWLKNVYCLPVSNWADANTAAARLKNGRCGLSDHSFSGDWRLPTPSEWHATLAKAEELDCRGVDPGISYGPLLTDTAGTQCYRTGPSKPFNLDQINDFWSSLSDQDNPATAFFRDLDFGAGGSAEKTNGVNFTPWPVRSGY